jgi:hypothetical protein
MLRDDYGDVALIASQQPCPQCGAQTTRLGEPKPSLPVEIVTAVLEADLSPEDMSKLARVLREASPDVSPRELADRAQLPAASTVITVASRAGKNWIAVLALVLTVVAIYVAHSDAQQAHRDAERAIHQAHVDAEQALREARQPARSTGTLSDDDVRHIVQQIEHELQPDK